MVRIEDLKEGVQIIANQQHHPDRAGKLIGVIHNETVKFYRNGTLSSESPAYLLDLEKFDLLVPAEPDRPNKTAKLDW